MGCVPSKDSKVTITEKSSEAGRESLDKKGSIRDNYTFHEVIATGAFGNIRRGVHKETKETFAVRELTGRRGEIEKCFSQVDVLKELVLVIVRL
jgi:hypothetical protein